MRYVHGGLCRRSWCQSHISRAVPPGRRAQSESFRNPADDRPHHHRSDHGRLPQTEPVGRKKSGTNRAGWPGALADGKGVLISNEVPIAFNSTSKDSADRHACHIFAGRRCRPGFNNTTVELGVSEQIPGSSQMRQLDVKAEYLLKRAACSPMTDSISEAECVVAECVFGEMRLGVRWDYGRWIQ